MICIVALPGDIQGVAIFGGVVPVLDQGIALHCRIEGELLTVHLNCTINQILIVKPVRPIRLSATSCTQITRRLRKPVHGD